MPKLAFMKREFLIENEMAHLEYALLFYQNRRFVDQFCNLFKYQI